VGGAQVAPIANWQEKILVKIPLEQLTLGLVATVPAEHAAVQTAPLIMLMPSLQEGLNAFRTCCTAAHGAWQLKMEGCNSEFTHARRTGDG
jgi:hypothetical protein